MHPCKFAHAFLVVSGMLFVGIKKERQKKKRKEVLHFGRRRQILAAGRVFLAS